MTRPADSFCFSDPRQTGRRLFEWSDGAGADDPRFGHEMPVTTGDALGVRRQAFVGAVVDNPAERAVQIARVLGTEVVFRNPGAGFLVTRWRACPSATMSWLCTDSPPTRASCSGVEPPSTADARARAGSIVAGAGRAGLLEGNFGVLWADHNSIVLDPVSTGGVGIVLVEGLLSGIRRCLTPFFAGGRPGPFSRPDELVRRYVMASRRDFAPVTSSVAYRGPCPFGDTHRIRGFQAEERRDPRAS